jgi:hypothetical protein
MGFNKIGTFSEFPKVLLAPPNFEMSDAISAVKAAVVCFAEPCRWAASRLPYGRTAKNPPAFFRTISGSFPSESPAAGLSAHSHLAPAVYSQP